MGIIRNKRKVINGNVKAVISLLKKHHAYRLKVGDIYEDCSCHPVRCTYINIFKNDIEGVSMLDGSRPRSCSLFACGIVKLTEEEAKVRIEAYQRDGQRGLMRLNGWSGEDYDEFQKNQS